LFEDEDEDEDEDDFLTTKYLRIKIWSEVGMMSTFEKDDY
jgi:hypothetical protein